MHQLKEFHESDYEEMKSWYNKRNEDCIPIHFLPKVGFIIPNICVGFLYQTDGKFGLIENFITNPDADKKDRHEALDLLIQKLLDTAKELNYTYIIATTNDESILKRGRRAGAESIGTYDLIYKKL